MRIIEIIALPNGAHRNQTWYEEIIPEGWAFIPTGNIPTSFPFVDIETAVIDGVSTVIAMTEREVPVAEEPEPEPSAEEQLRADIDYLAIMTGVEL